MLGVTGVCMMYCHIPVLVTVFNSQVFQSVMAHKMDHHDNDRARSPGVVQWHRPYDDESTAHWQVPGTWSRPCESAGMGSINDLNC